MTESIQRSPLSGTASTPIDCACAATEAAELLRLWLTRLDERKDSSGAVEEKALCDRIEASIQALASREGKSRRLAELVLAMGMVTEKGLQARDLSRQLLGIPHGRVGGDTRR